MYIMCVILCLFSALSRSVGALQISIIIIIIIMSPWHNRTGWLGVKHQVTYLDV